ncbi:MAG TPA: T9SS type A sorting domain-containing protein [Bacteroidia bacterium]|nr:T9SS type A sorting domain-containing protein [Bacteroidia bacterium]
MPAKPNYTLVKCVFSILFLLVVSHQEALSQCSNTLNPGTPYNVTPTTADAVYNCCQAQGTYYLEYGLRNFTPGTTSTAGTGGTLVIVPSNPSQYTIAGLTPSTTYDYYMRIHCTAGTWSVNSIVKTFSTVPDCNTSPFVSCGTIIPLSIDTGPGGWNISGCNGGYGKEAIYRFTAAYSGNHMLLMHSNGTQNPTNMYYKPQSAGCDRIGWTCIGQAWPQGVRQYSFGPLTAGIDYYFFADPQGSSVASTTDQFMIECPTCPAPANVTTLTAGPTAIKISWTGSADWIEYGPEGFMPGSGAGTSTWVNGNLNTYSITGLTPATHYDVYLRADCGGSVSPRSLKLWTSTSSCPAPIVYPSLGTEINAMGGLGFYDYYPNTNCLMVTEGTETFVSFTPPASGYYDVRVYHPGYYGIYNFLTRPANAICDLANYACALPAIQDDYDDLIRWGPLTAGNSYDVLFDTEDTSTMSWGSYSFVISCPKPDSVTAYDIRPNSITFSWSTNCPNTTCIEYGPTGFTPGTGAVAGTNGTLVQNVSTPYNLTGLTKDTKYDVYIRSNCGGQFSANSSKISVQTAVKCSDAPAVSCGDYLQFCTDGFSAVDGAWAPAFCGNNNNQSKEGVWKFTPAQTGAYSIFVYDFSANSIYYTYSANFYIKQASLGCNELNWNCAGSVAGSLYYGFDAVTLSLGTLTAGTTYYILADGLMISFAGGFCYSFRIDCFNVCPQPILSHLSNINLTGGTINAVCDSCQGNVTLEYGPAGFTPGTGAAAGTGGTVFSNVYFPFTLSGLTTGTTYDVYVRRSCGAPNGFSVNSVKLALTPCSVVPTGIATDAVDNIFCLGDSVTLSQVGGVLAPGGAYKWYSGYCGNTLIGTGSSIKVSPSTTAYYYMRSEAACGISLCFSTTLYPTSNGPSATVTAAGPVTFCSGDSVRLNANTGSGLTYKWKKNGTIIPGATGSFYYAKTTGAYSVMVTNPCSSLTSSQLSVNVNALPSAAITAGGPTTFCSGGSVNLSVTSGTNKTYQWMKGGVNISGATSSTYNATIAGNYKATVTNTVTGCSGITSPATLVTVNQQPAATITPQGPVTFCAGGSVLLKGNNGTGLTYKWKKNTVFISGATNKNYTATTAGTYRLQVTNSNGCSKTSAGVVVSVPCRDNGYVTGEDISAGNTADFIAFPNPSTGTFTIQFEEAPFETIRIFIKDVMGKVIEILETKERTILIDKPDLASGIYFITAENATGIMVKKISIERK